MPSPLAPADLAALRALAPELSMPDTCDIVRVISNPDEGGGQTETETTVAADVPCRYSETFSQRESSLVARLGTTIDAKLTVPALTDITQKDRIANLTVGGVAFGSYEVRAVIRRSEEVIRGVFIARI